MKKFLQTSAVIALLSYIPQAFAQDEAASEAVDGDIVVTANRSESLVSKTPIAVSAISGDGLAEAGVTDARSLGDLVPNLRLTENGQEARISIRGVTSTDTTEKGDPSAAFLLDGIYIARPAGILGAFYDVERVEVLRGPQGTLYGRNTTAGVINVISARPKDTLAASFDGRYGNLNSLGLTGMFNLPVADGLGLRAVVNYDRQDSNLIKGVPSAIPLNPFRDAISGRLSFGGRLGDNFDFVIRGDYSNMKGSITNAVPLNTFFTLRNIGQDPLYVDSSSRNQRTLPFAETLPNQRDNTFWGVMGEFTYDFGPVQLTYLASHRDTDLNDVRNARLFGGLNNPAFFTGDFKQDSHELRAAFGSGNRLHGQVGLYYFNEKSNIEFNLGAPLAGFIAPGATGFAFPQGPTINRSKAGFGQITYDVTPEFHLTAGIRYTEDFKSRDGATVVDFPTALAQAGAVTAGAVVAANCNAQFRCVLNENIAARTFKRTTWKVGFDYDIADLGLVYGSVSTGYKAGGFNDGCITGSGLGCGLNAGQLFYNPETLTAYEGGLKFKVLDNALRFNLAFFHYDYKNLQLSTAITVGNAPQNLTQNAGSAKVDGVEFDATAFLSPNDRFNFAVNYTNARYSTFIPRLASGESRNFAGLQLDQAPEFTASAGYEHTFPMANGGEFVAGVQSRLSSAYYMQDLGILAQYRQPSFTKTDLSLNYNAPNKRWYIGAYAKNLENEITISFANSGIGSAAGIEEPRTYGARAGFKF
jgi:iron complex outermembrane receptor protein